MDTSEDTLLDITTVSLWTSSHDEDVSSRENKPSIDCIHHSHTQDLVTISLLVSIREAGVQDLECICKCQGIWDQPLKHTQTQYYWIMVLGY